MCRKLSAGKKSNIMAPRNKLKRTKLHKIMKKQGKINWIVFPVSHLIFKMQKMLKCAEFKSIINCDMLF